MIIRPKTSHRIVNRRVIVIFTLMGLLGGCLSPNVGKPIVDRKTVGAGVLKLLNFREIWISPDDLVYTGKATFTWPDGRVYRGSFNNGQPSGVGREELPNGETYDGRWLDGKRHGHGALDLPDGTQYVGAFEAGNRHGLGHHQSPNGSYTGLWVMDTPHGHGEFRYNDGATYIGEWREGRQDGEGIYFHPKGDRYDGEWRQGVPHGHGTMNEPNGESYTGELFSGARAGYGRITTRAGITYEGTWHSDKRHGFGLETYADDSHYKGEWANDQRNGEGRAHFPNQFDHEGNWENNISLGPGTRLYTTGVEITGIWNSDSVSSGILKLPSGKEYAGDLYDNDNAVVSPLLVAWLTKTANANDGHAQLLLGDTYSKHKSPKRNLNLAKKWYQSAAQAGIAEAQYQLGKILVTQGKIDDGLDSLIAAYNTDHVGASLLLGSYYQLGNHVTKDEKTARRLFELASEGGSITARNNLAWLLSTSVNASIRDGTKAVELIRPIAYLYNDWSYFDTFAAALAEDGDYASARDAQTHAISLAKNADVPPTEAILNEMHMRLKLFHNETPFRNLDDTARETRNHR